MAHPHVWVTMKSSLVANASGQIAEVAVAWSFDEIYAQMALDGMDKDGDGTYSSEELKALTEENISSLRGYDYFMHIKVDGKLQPVANVTKASQTYINNVLTLHFTIPLQTSG